MSVYNKVTNSVADAVSKIMNEKLHPNQQKLDVHEPEKDKLTAKDFEMLRKGKKAVKEDTAKPDFLDLDKDGNKKEPMKKASISMKKEELEESSYNNPHKFAAAEIKAGTFKSYSPTASTTGLSSDQLRIKKEIAADRLEQKMKNQMKKEEAEQIQEYTSVGGKYVHRQKEVKDAEAGVTDWDKEEKMAKDAVKPAAKKRAYGAHQNRRTNTKLYKEMIESLKTGGIKSLFKTIEEGKIELNEDNLDSIAKKHGMELKKTTYGAGMKHPTHGEVSINRYGEWHHYPAGSKSSKAHGNSTDNFASLDKHLSSLKEEASQEEFTKEMQDQKAKFDGKKKTADIAAPASQGVVDVKEATHTEIQMVDLTDASQKPQISTVDLEEKTLTEPETKKKEEVVKSMKKGIAGFKERYGDRAKSVMYATATNIAKDKA